MKATPIRAHSPDFRSVTWNYETFYLTPTQAAVVAILWQAWENGAPDVSGAYLLEAVDSTATRLLDLFRRSPAWGRLIVRGATKGTYRLVPALDEQQENCAKAA